MSRLLAVLPLFLAFGCTSVVVLGFEDGGTSSGGRRGISSAATSAGAGSTSGSSAGTTSGSVGGQSSATGTTGGTTGRTSAGNTTGSSTGTSTGWTGPCLHNGTSCSNSDQCCSGACDGTCNQGFGQECLGPNDCSSRNCVNNECACAGANPGPPFGSCATDEDCCGDSGCTLSTYDSQQFGSCCRDVGQSCAGSEDCCDQSCENGECQCLPGGSFCRFIASGCCSGICL